MKTIKKIFRLLFNSKKVTKKDYKNSEDVVKRRVEELKRQKY